MLHCRDVKMSTWSSPDIVNEVLLKFSFVSDQVIVSLILRLAEMLFGKLQAVTNRWTLVKKKIKQFQINFAQ